MDSVTHDRGVWRYGEEAFAQQWVMLMMVVVSLNAPLH